jgi:hypothetical protein
MSLTESVFRMGAHSATEGSEMTLKKEKLDRPWTDTAQ